MLVTAVAAVADVESIAGTARAFKGDVIIIDGAKVTLFGISAPAPSEQCMKAGKAWPFGVEAKKALADLVDGGHVVCWIKNKVGHGSWQGTCALGTADLGEAMVRAGWASAVTDMTNAYAAAQAEAQSNHKGIWEVR